MTDAMLSRGSCAKLLTGSCNWNDVCLVTSRLFILLN